MKRFMFRLERVLAYRTAQLGVEKAKLSAVESELQARRQALEAVNADFAREVKDVFPTPPARTELGRYRMLVESERIVLGARIAEKQLEVDAQRQRYVLANQAAEVLDRVKSKQRKDWDLQLGKELDGLAMDSYLSRWKH